MAAIVLLETSVQQKPFVNRIGLCVLLDDGRSIETTSCSNNLQ